MPPSQPRYAAALFDFSGTLYRLEEDDSWFGGMSVQHHQVDGHLQAELMRRLTAPTGRTVEMGPQEYHAWVNRDLAPHLHREAYLHVLRESGRNRFVDEFVLSFDVGVVKPDPRIFTLALERIGVAAADAVMVGDSDEADGGARVVGCTFILVDPLPTWERPAGVRTALRAHGFDL